MSKQIEFTDDEAKNLETFIERIPCTGFTEALALVQLGQKIKRSIHSFELVKKDNKDKEE